MTASARNMKRAHFNITTGRLKVVLVRGLVSPGSTTVPSSFSTDSTELERTMIGLSIAGAWTMSCGEVAVGLDPWKTWQRERAAESCGGRAGQGEARVGERSRGGEAARRRLPWRAAGTQKCGERGCASRAGERRRRPRARRSCVGLFAGQARRRALTGNRRGGRGCAAVHRLLFFDPLVL